MSSLNSEVLYSSLPSINIQRSILDIPFDHKTTFNAGLLIPVYVDEMLPGSSVKIQSNKIIRAQTLLTPLMDNLELSTFWFFVPSRLTWIHWKEFMGENTASAYLPQVTYRPPRIVYGYYSEDGQSVNHGTIHVNSVADYMTIPTVREGISGQTGNWFLAQYLRSYWLVWNEFIRDQNLQDPINIPLGDSDIDWKDLSETMQNPLPVNKFHDYFTSALKAPQKAASAIAAAVTGDLSDVNVVTKSTIHGVGTAGLHGKELHTNTKGYLIPVGSGSDNYSIPTNGYADAQFYGHDSDPAYGFTPDNLFAKTSELNISSLGVSVPNLRMAFQMQKFLEREASHGSRYCETLLSHFSVRAQDSRLQRPEYLGGNQIPLNISQVVNSAQSSGEFLGDVGGMSVTADSHFDVEYSAQEHGIILCCVAVRYRHSYSQGLDRKFQRTTRFDYAWPEFSHLTDQPIRNFEIFGEAQNDYDVNGVFGYQERYAEYRWKPSKTTGEMRPGVSGSLAAWHLGDLYSTGPYLSADWIKENKAPVDRALAVTSEVSNQFFGDFYFKCRWTLPLPLHSDPGYADHF